MDLVVVPNRKNTATELMLPVKLLDSVALGIPVVVPRLKAIEYYFSDDMVFYFEPDNVDSLADTILYAYNNRDERIRKAENAKSFLEKYGWEKHKFDLINMYKSLS
jgi:glycosyltransferase involved in cell wall biosynthesis